MMNLDSAVHFLFRGLSAMQSPTRPTTTTVFLPGGESHPTGSHSHLSHKHGPAHECTLLVKMRHVDLDDMTWLPASVAIDSDGDQVGIWTIVPGSHLRISGRGKPIGGRRLNGTAEALKLYKLHSGLKTKSVTEQPDLVSIVTLHSGEVGYEGERKVCVKQKDANSEEKRQEIVVANVKRWSTHASTSEGILVSTESGWLPIYPYEEKSTLEPAAVVTITNIARVRHPLGLEHFSHYYTLVSDVSDKASLSDCSDVSAQASLSSVGKMRDEPVWDCVPPVDLP